MRLLYVCGTYYPSTGGAEISAYTLLRELAKKPGCDVAVMTDERYAELNDGIKVYLTSHEKRGEKLEGVIDEFKPDAIFTQLMWSDVALKKSNEIGLPSVLRVCKIPFNLDISYGSVYSPSSIISISKKVKNYVINEFNRQSEIIHSAIDIEELRKNYSNPEKKYVTMFNPIKRKGGKIFRSLAKEFPNKEFSVVLGWSSLKNARGSETFSKKYISRITESLGKNEGGGLPEYVDMKGLDNVTYLKPGMDVWRIYEKTKILLVPSQWEEAFGRVALEGMSLGIPVIASKVGGLKEVVKGGGLLVEDYDEVSAWKKKLKKLFDDKRYQEVSESCKQKSKKYSLEKNVKHHYELFQKACNKLRVHGGGLVRGKKKIILRGVSIVEPYKLVNKRERSPEKVLEEVKDHGFNAVRVPIHPGRYRVVENYLDEYVDRIVKKCEELSVHCILDWHGIGNPLTGETRLKEQFVEKGGKNYYLHDANIKLARQAWKEISQEYGECEHVLFEVFNEPAPGDEAVKKLGLSALKWSNWKKELEKLLSIIRQNSSNVVILSPTRWAYDLSKVANNPVKASNIMYSVHPYPVHDDWKENFEAASHLPLIVTEWGFREKTPHKFMRGSVEGYGKKILEYMGEHGISWLAWCYDDVWSPRIFKKLKYDERELTEWGELLLRRSEE